MAVEWLQNGGQADRLPSCLSPGQVRHRALFVVAIVISVVAVAALLFGLGATPLLAQEPEGVYDEAEAQGIDRMLMCPVCPAESIDQAQVPLARQMRQRVREMLAQGATREEILAYFADRYGQNVLASPPKSGANLLAWLLPVFGLAAALIAALMVIRSMTGRNGAVGVSPLAEQDATAPVGESDLDRYLDAVDRSLDIGHAAPDPAGDGDDGSERPMSDPEKR